LDGELLTRQALNRATLARQLLLERADRNLLAAVEHLVGLQAQLPQNPYIGLWSRLAGFEADELERQLLDRRVVRVAAMRATLHLVSATDCLLLRPLVQPVLDDELARHPEYAPALRSVDLGEVVAVAEPFLAARALTGRELREALGEHFPGLDPAALAYACRNRLALVQVPPRGLWGRSGQVRVTTAEAWIGRPLASSPSIHDLVLRYLAAFGPASAADVAAWSRLTGFREILDSLRSRLRVFCDEQGRELFDLPDGPRPDPETPAPPRFLPEYDNLLLSHADRTRVIDQATRKAMSLAPARHRGTLLVDGFAAGTWWIEEDRAGREAALLVRPASRLRRRDAASVEVEGRRLLRFVAGDRTRGVRVC
jgi:hypothetical protein